jgi:hypothetical protein
MFTAFFSFYLQKLGTAARAAVVRVVGGVLELENVPLFTRRHGRARVSFKILSIPSPSNGLNALLA